MAKPAARIRLLEVTFIIAIAAVVGRAAQLQLLEGRRWTAEAVRTRTVQDTIPPRRGALMDRDGTPLAVTQEYYHVGIAPREVTDRRVLVRTAARSLELSASQLERDLGRGKPYLYYHGPFTASQVEPLRTLRGVHLEREYARFYPSAGLARPIIGALEADGRQGASGLELSLDSILTGIAGEQVLLKDPAGRRYESPSRIVREPVPGYDVVLTIDYELQEIAETGLENAMRTLEADGGDVVFYDPRNGEVLALASRQRGRNGLTARPTTVTDPFEPGSTAKLFTAAALLSRGLVGETDAEYAENGLWLMPVGNTTPRKIEDSHASKGSLTLAQAIEVSSNIAMAKFAQRLRPEEQYEALRNFGFGSPTGVEFPSESRGLFQRPDKWRPLWSRASIAIGYEFGVTPLQLAAAYGAIANEGILLAPTLVREIRTAGGEVVYRHQPEPVRRAVRPEIAARLRGFLLGAVGEGGTGERAQMVNYTLLGKTGTAKRFGETGYIEGEYTASFAALFPVDHPQLVVIVKLDNPKGNYYGGQTAAPLTKSMLQQALAARQVAIDRTRFLAPEVETTVAPAEARPAGRPVVAVDWPWRPDTTSLMRAAVPDVGGMSARRAVAALHRRGFRVTLHGLGTVARSSPAPGDSATAGSAVTVWAE